MRGGSIPHARSKFESKVRKVIGGGEMRNWARDNGMYRGGGSYSDALKLLVDASGTEPGRVLSGCYTVRSARAALFLPCELQVPVTKEDLVMKNFNNSATAGPLYRSFGIKGKCGLKESLEDFAWECLDGYASGGSAEECLPFVAARVGYRTKLLDLESAFKKLTAGKPLGRCVMMLDAHEQAFSSALYNVLSRATHEMRYFMRSGFRNTSIRASSDWARLWEEVRQAKVIVELDWKKFDRERPVEDIRFMIDVIISCFKPKNRYEERLLDAHRIMLNRSLVDRLFVTDDGGVFGIDGMVPSGSLWTGWLDTALNLLYMKSALAHLGLSEHMAYPKCAGDDNLTLFTEDVPDHHLNELRSVLNEWFRAGIEDEDWFIHRPPFHVTRVQAVFPIGVDLSKGTSSLLDQAVWIPVGEEMVIDQAAGLSHRWKYVFEGKPKFLGCYWEENGNPIRPAHVNAEKLLWPEGVHKTIDDYEAAVVSMVVDNPFNHHNVNHMMHRYCIIQQVRRLSVAGISVNHILALSHIRSKGGEEVPLPMIASWRRMEGWCDMENLPELKLHIEHFRSFVSGVSSLYARKPSGGLDAWRFMDMIRGNVELAEGQFGNDLMEWASFLREHPVTKYLKPTRGLRPRTWGAPAVGEALERFTLLMKAVKEMGSRAPFKDSESYANWISDRIRRSNQM